MFRPRLRPVPFVASLVLGLSSASCYQRSYRDPVVVLPPPYDLWEIEPNDQAAFPDAIGPLAVGESLIIGGHLTEHGPDFFDGFAFQSVEPCDIQFSLVALDAAADLDLCVWDPEAGQFAFCFENAGHIESGVFSVPSGLSDFHLVLSSYDGASEYRLRVDCVPITFGALAAPAAVGPERERAVPYERYSEPADASGELETRVIARGAVLEIDLATGDVREARFEVREARK